MGEQLSQAVVVDVGPGVIGLQAFGFDVVAGEELERAGNERGDCRGLLVAVDLGVGQAAVVIDDRVAELPADAGAQFGAGAVSVAGQRVTGTGEACEAFGVHLQQISRPIATRRWSRGSGRSGCGSALAGSRDSHRMGRW